MNRVIGIIASDEVLRKRIEQLFPEEVKSGTILIDLLDSSRIEEQGRQLEALGAQAIIARSGGYRHTLGTVNIPVIQLEISTPDILYALKAGEVHGRPMTLFLSPLEYFELSQWERFFEVPIELRVFEDLRDIEPLVKSTFEKAKDQVIIGGGIPCGVAQKLGMDYVFIGASKESIHEVVSYASELVERIYEEHYKTELIAKTLDEVHDAVLAVNLQGEIILFNARAEELLGTSEKDVIHKPLMSCFPELEIVLQSLEPDKALSDVIVHVRRHVTLVNTNSLKVGNQVIGALCSFSDITRLQSLEKKIRMELGHKGLRAKHQFEDILAYSESMKATIARAMRMSETEETVILYGESGTGKEMFAQSIHQGGRRRNEPFVAVNCAALAESLLESELFGYQEGAFTGARKGGKPGLFELAHGGTMFLDEINSMSLNLQAKILRVIEEKEVMRLGSDHVMPLDIRLIAATNGNLRSLTERGLFRSDLFYRLSILELNIPPLRERKEDIVPLFCHYGQISDICPVLSQEDQKKLLNYPWKGNVRELKNVAKRYQLFREIQLETLEYEKSQREKYQETENQLEKTEFRSDLSPLDPNETSLNLKEIQQVVEQSLIDYLGGKGFSKKEIASRLGISRASLWNKSGKKKD